MPDHGQNGVTTTAYQLNDKKKDMMVALQPDILEALYLRELPWFIEEINIATHSFEQRFKHI